MDAENNRKTMNVAEPSESQPVLGVNVNYPVLDLGEPKPLASDPIDIRARNSPCGSPSGNSPGLFGLPVPSPIITKRNRSASTHERASRNPVEKGTIKYFSRSKGHGFISCEQPGEDIFVHITDIDGEYVPKEGDEVTFRRCPLPPKFEKFQATHVQIINFTPEVHLKWDAPLAAEEINKTEDGCPGHGTNIVT